MLFIKSQVLDQFYLLFEMSYIIVNKLLPIFHYLNSFWYFSSQSPFFLRDWATVNINFDPKPQLPHLTNELWWVLKVTSLTPKGCSTNPLRQSLQAPTFCNLQNVNGLYFFLPVVILWLIYNHLIYFCAKNEAWEKLQKKKGSLKQFPFKKTLLRPKKL